MSAPDRHEANKALLEPLRRAMHDWSTEAISAALAGAFASDAEVHLAFPFEDIDGPDGFLAEALAPLGAALPDAERRDFIVIAGSDPDGNDWVGCAGHYTGTFRAPLLGIPPTGHIASMRFHEFFRVVDGRVVEVQALWDIPELIMQAGAWPMGPSLGREWTVPGPAGCDGLVPGPRDPLRSQASCEHVMAMLADMGRHPREPEEAMRLEHWWHRDFNWYGPAGIGTSRGIRGFRDRHQIPFLKAMPDRRGGYAGDGHFFADGDYVGVTGWPGMSMTFSGGGWLGIAPTGQAITMRSLDFWRVEQGPQGLRIRENWVLVDLLHVWDQLGVDVLGRMRELSKARPA